MRPLWFVLPLLLTLAACDDPDTPAPSTADAPAAQPAATEVREGLAGIWRPRGESDLNALVLEDQGQLYLVGDGERRGLRWEKATDDAVTLHYLSGGDTLTEDDLRVSLDNPSLTLEGESPLAGEYRRDPAGIGTLEGRVTLPEAGAVPDNGVLVLTLRDLSASDGEGDGQLARRLTRLSLEGDMSMPFDHFLPRLSSDIPAMIFFGFGCVWMYRLVPTMPYSSASVQTNTNVYRGVSSAAKISAR